MRRFYCRACDLPYWAADCASCGREVRSRGPKPKRHCSVTCRVNAWRKRQRERRVRIE